MSGDLFWSWRAWDHGWGWLPPAIIEVAAMVRRLCGVVRPCFSFGLASLAVTEIGVPGRSQWWLDKAVRAWRWWVSQLHNSSLAFYLRASPAVVGPTEPYLTPGGWERSILTGGRSSRLLDVVAHRRDRASWFTVSTVRLANGYEVG